MADPYAPPKPPTQPMAPQQPNQFDAMRRRMQQTNQVQMGKAQDQQNEALNRKFAAGGIANSGAAIRAQQVGNQELQGQFTDQLNQQQGAVDQMEVQSNEAQRGRDFQSREAQLGRDFQGSQFDRSFGLDQEMKRGQLGLAGREMDLKNQEQQFNIGNKLWEQGYGIDQTQYLGSNMRDSTGNVINPNGQGLAYEQRYGMYAPGANLSYDAMQRRLAEEKKLQEDPSRVHLKNPETAKYFA